VFEALSLFDVAKQSEIISLIHFHTSLFFTLSSRLILVPAIRVHFTVIIRCASLSFFIQSCTLTVEGPWIRDNTACSYATLKVLIARVAFLESLADLFLTELGLTVDSFLTRSSSIQMLTLHVFDFLTCFSDNFFVDLWIEGLLFFIVHKLFKWGDPCKFIQRKCAGFVIGAFERGDRGNGWVRAMWEAGEFKDGSVAIDDWAFYNTLSRT
jgi:hypothetical protein